MHSVPRYIYNKAVFALLVLMLCALPALAWPPKPAEISNSPLVRISSGTGNYLDAETGVRIWLPDQLRGPPNHRSRLRHGGIDNGWDIPGQISINVLAYDSTRSLSDLYYGLRSLRGRKISDHLSHLAKKEFRLVGHDRGSPFHVVARERDGRVRALSVVIPNGPYYKRNRQTAQQLMTKIIFSFEPFWAEPPNQALPPLTSPTPQPNPPPPNRTEPPPVPSQPAWKVPRRSADGKFMELIGGTYGGRPMLETRAGQELTRARCAAACAERPACKAYTSLENGKCLLWDRRSEPSAASSPRTVSGYKIGQ